LRPLPERSRSNIQVSAIQGRLHGDGPSSFLSSFPQPSTPAAHTMRESALWFYRNMTRVKRDRLLAQLSHEGNVPIAILFYHRVADNHPNKWTIGQDDFRRHLDWLQQNFDVVSLAEAQRRIRAPHCDRPTVSITFDDGYSDNARYAIPEIIQRELTCAYFVSTSFVTSRQPFPHDAAAGVPLLANTIEELRQFVEQGIEIGAHTRTHLDIGKLPVERFNDEIKGSIDDLERWLNITVRYFAFPYGMPHNTSQASVDFLASLGIRGICTAYGAFNFPGQSGFHLRRIHGDPRIERLKNWLTFDPRKVYDDQTLPFNEASAPVYANDESPCQ
jgi:peptidoglycan/xylan/chitin deacetylase (PgdA/CDA1 family)